MGVVGCKGRASAQSQPGVINGIASSDRVNTGLSQTADQQVAGKHWAARLMH